MGFITPLIAFILLVAGVLAVFVKGSIGQSIRGVLGAIPFGNPKLWGVIVIALGLMFGGIAYGTSIWSSATGSLSTAAITGGASSASTQLAAPSCTFASYERITGKAGTNQTFRADNSDLTHLYVDIGSSMTQGQINGTLSCNSNRADISKGAQSTCHVEADGFRSMTSTTDAATYYILDTSAKVSKVASMPWATVSYLADSASALTPATTSSDQEKTQLVYAQDEANQKLGFYLQTPTSAVVNYLDNQTSKDARIVCDGSTVARFTFTKVA